MRMCAAWGLSLINYAIIKVKQVLVLHRTAFRIGSLPAKEGDFHNFREVRELRAHLRPDSRSDGQIFSQGISRSASD